MKREVRQHPVCVREGVPPKAADEGCAKRSARRQCLTTILTTYARRWSHARLTRRFAKRNGTLSLKVLGVLFARGGS